MADEGKISITVAEYRKLRFADEKLNILEASGVDNWEGYASLRENQP
jgi:hypothetical protein